MDSVTAAQETACRLSGELAAIEVELGFCVPPFDWLTNIERALEAIDRLTQRKERTYGVRTSAGDTDRSVQLNTVADSHTRNPSSR